MKCSLCSKDFIPGVEEQDTCEQCLPSLRWLTDNKGKDEYQVDYLMDDIPEMSNSPLVSYTRLSPIIQVYELTKLTRLLTLRGWSRIPPNTR